MDIIRQMFIPTVGTVIKLVQPWTFKLYQEHRNTGMFTHFKLPRQYGLKSEMVTLPVDAELKIDRIFIKQNAPEYDSVSFYWLKESIPAKKSIRFWAKLKHVNEIVFQIKE